MSISPLSSLALRSKNQVKIIMDPRHVSWHWLSSTFSASGVTSPLTQELCWSLWRTQTRSSMVSCLWCSFLASSSWFSRDMWTGAILRPSKTGALKTLAKRRNLSSISKRWVSDAQTPNLWPWKWGPWKRQSLTLRVVELSSSSSKWWVAAMMQVVASMTLEWTLPTPRKPSMWCTWLWSSLSMYSYSGTSQFKVTRSCLVKPSVPQTIKRTVEISKPMVTWELSTS